jgi:hypothetical protein
MLVNLSPPLRVFALAFALFSGVAAALGQTPAPAGQNPANDPDSEIVTTPTGPPRTPAQLKDQAWSMLKAGVLDTKRPQTQIQALAALGTMGNNERSIGMIRAATDDKDVDVRVAAALAAGQTRSRDLTTDLRRLLDDKEPAVAYIAALTLWKMHDRSGEDILTAVADGERKTAPGLMHGTEHDIDKQLHDPVGIAKFGALQGASMFLGPFGYGITAYEYIHKNGGDSARVTAIEAIAQNHARLWRATTRLRCRRSSRRSSTTASRPCGLRPRPRTWSAPASHRAARSTARTRSALGNHKPPGNRKL